MTSFKGPPPVETQEGTPPSTPPPETGETKPENKVVEYVPEPRLKASPKLWKEAMGLAKMLTHCRPHKSRSESLFINEYISPVGVTFDKQGNAYKRIGDAPILWSSHVDTVHNKGGIQRIVYWPNKTTGDTFLGVRDDEKSSCLGADDTAGVWLMLEMIKRKVPGLYIFHRGEECGGIGSRWIAANNKKVLEGIKFAVAFDRKGTESVITFQRSTRCCSDDFAKSLAEQLGMNHKCDETGSFTDTASYVDLIAECTNVSAGYYDAHSKTENVNVDYLLKLRDAICKIDVSKLVESRKPGENTSRWGTYTGKGRYYDDYGYGGDWWGQEYRKQQDRDRPKDGFTYYELKEMYPPNSWGSWLEDYEYDTKSGFYVPKPGVTPKHPKKDEKKDLGVTKVAPSNGKRRTSFNEAVKLVRHNPMPIADLLETLGYGSEEIRDHLRASWVSGNSHH